MKGGRQVSEEFRLKNMLKNKHIRKILFLMNNSKKSAFELSKELEISAATINHYLEQLKEVGLVKECFSRVVGNQTERFYSLTQESLKFPISFNQEVEEKKEWVKETLIECQNMVSKQTAKDEFCFAEGAFKLKEEQLDEAKPMLSELAEELKQLEKTTNEQIVANKDQELTQYRFLVLLVPGN
jgi:predicted transcriptional regulator